MRCLRQICFQAANQFCVDFVDAEVFTNDAPKLPEPKVLCFGLVGQGGVEAHHGHADLVGCSVLCVGCGGNRRQAETVRAMVLVCHSK